MSDNANHEKATGNDRRDSRSDGSSDWEFSVHTAANRAQRRNDRTESPDSLPRKLPRTHDGSESNDGPNWLPDTQSADDLLLDHTLRLGRGTPPIAMDVNECVADIMSLLRPVRSAPPCFGVGTTTTQTNLQPENETTGGAEDSSVFENQDFENAANAGVEPTTQPGSIAPSRAGDHTATSSHSDHSTQSPQNVEDQWSTAAAGSRTPTDSDS